jgi:hypothetical protein
MAGLAAPLLSAQSIPPELITGDDGKREKRLPDGRSQTEAMLKEDHKRNMADLQKMKDLIGEVEKELEKNDRHVLSMDNLRKLEELEKTSRRVRERMRRF